MTEGRIAWRTAGIAGLGALASVALLGLLFRVLPFESEAYLESLAGVRSTGLVAIVVTTVIHCWITGVKWRYVTRLTSRDADLGAGYYLYSALIGLLGQVLPLQVAMLAGRSVALRLHARVPLKKGAGAVVYDQLFDLLVPLSMVPPIILAAAGIVSPRAGALLCLVTLVLSGALVAVCGEPLIRGGLRPLLVLTRPKSITRLVRALHDGSPLTDRRTLFRLFSLSTFRVANLVFRAWLVAWTLRLDFSWTILLFAHCGVTFSLVFAFLPGALGVVEWGWVGMLHLFGAGVVEATQYALSSRLFAVAALLLINLVHGMALVAYWLAAGRQPATDQEATRSPHADEELNLRD